MPVPGRGLLVGTRSVGPLGRPLGRCSGPRVGAERGVQVVVGDVDDGPPLGPLLQHGSGPGVHPGRSLPRSRV